MRPLASTSSSRRWKSRCARSRRTPGHGGAVVVGRLREAKDENFGFDAETGEFSDLGQGQRDRPSQCYPLGVAERRVYRRTEIQERVPESESIRTTRVSLNLLGDGFVEAVADQTLIDIARHQCATTHGKICGQVLYVPIVEAAGQTGVGRFGWKDQHAGLLSFSGDAYLNEMGITSRLFPDEVTKLRNTAPEPNNTVGPDGLDDVDHFARFIRATKAPARDAQLAETPRAKRGSELFDKIGCATCHVRTLTTAPAGTKIKGGTFTIPAPLGQKTFHPATRPGTWHRGNGPRRGLWCP